MSFGGSAGGSSSIAGSSDVVLDNPAMAQVLGYDTTTAKWKNQAQLAPGDATATTKGSVQLAGDLSGTATSPSVNFANDQLHVRRTGDTMAGPLAVQTANNSTGINLSTVTPTTTDNVYLAINARARFGYNGTNGSVLIDDNATGKAIQFNSNNAQVLRLSGTNGNNGANYLALSNGTAGAGTVITAGGSDANIPITITPKGSGTTILKNVVIPAGAAAGSVLTSDASGNATWQAAGAGYSLVKPSVQTASYTLTASDAGTAVEMNATAAVTVTIPPSSSVTFAIGTVIEIFQRGSGQVTVSPGAGVTIRTSTSGVLRAQYSVATLRLSTTDEWILAGDLV